MTDYRFKTWDETEVGEPVLRADAIALFAGYPALSDTGAGVFFGPTGTEYGPGTMVSGDIVSPDYVVTGHDNFVGGLPGTYPTTETSKTEQLAADRIIVLAGAASIKDDATILGVDGTYDFAAAIAAGNALGYDAGMADQYVLDVAEVQASAAFILDTAVILGVGGGYHVTTITPPGARPRNRMVEAVSLLADVFVGNAAITITYMQGDKTVAGIQATVGTQTYEVLDGDVMISYESREYILRTADLVSGGQAVVPRGGDRITEDNGKVYEVSVPKPLHVFQSIGPTGAVLKIRTKGPF